MYFKTYIPPAPLNQYVSIFTYYTEYAPDYAASRILPDGSVELILMLDEIPRTFYKDAQYKDAHDRDGQNKDARRVISCKKTVLCGLQKGYVYADATGHSVFSIKFNAGGSYPFLHLPTGELNNLFVDAEQVLGNSVLSLRERLLTLTDPCEMFRLAEEFLLHHLVHAQQPQRVIHAAVERLRHRGPSITLKQLADELGYSQKQFIHIFKERVGVSPKYYQRIERFNRVLSTVEQQQRINWAQVGVACGYYDQAHLINDFKFFSNVTPGQYLDQKGDFAHFIPIYQKG